MIAVVDAHMRFDGNCIAAAARHVRETGALACALTYHNAGCAFEGTPYAGGRIVYRAKDGATKYPLCAKWSRDAAPGPRGAVLGACYVFPRAWYYAVGQPLAALPGWGCDEEALSISAWMSGRAVECLDVRCAHLWRARPPWSVSPEEIAAVYASRMALVHAVATEAGARRELDAWLRSGVGAGVAPCISPEGERWRLAMLKQPRTWREWRAQVCEPDEIDGAQAAPAPHVAEGQQPRPAPVRNPVVPMYGVRCVHCQTVHDPKHLLVTHTYPNGNRRHVCPACRNPFVSVYRDSVNLPATS